MKYSVSRKINCGTSTESFEITAPDFETAQMEGIQQAVNDYGWDADDVYITEQTEAEIISDSNEINYPEFCKYLAENKLNYTQKQIRIVSNHEFERQCKYWNPRNHNVIPRSSWEWAEVCEKDDYVRIIVTCYEEPDEKEMQQKNCIPWLVKNKSGQILFQIEAPDQHIAWSRAVEKAVLEYDCHPDDVCIQSVKDSNIDEEKD